MRIVSAEIAGFRNLADFVLTDAAQNNLIMGRNAQGKTNLLEALASGVFGESFRLSSDWAVVRQEATTASVKVEFMADDESLRSAQVVWSLTGERRVKQVKLDGVVVRQAALARTFPAVAFSPEDIDLIRLSPSYRRRFMDQALSAVDPEYGELLSKYTTILKQRNQLLLTVKQLRAEAGELDVWDEQIAEAGAALVSKRTKFIHELNSWTGELYRRLFGEGGRGELKIVYEPSLNEDYARNYLERLKLTRSLDVVRATTTKGAHRDDLAFLIGGQDVRSTASRGEFRSIVIALKLAEARSLSTKLSQSPIYFLDDVLSELDEDRREAIVGELVGQVWLTTSDPSGVGLFEAPKVFEVEAGVVMASLALPV